MKYNELLKTLKLPRDASIADILEAHREWGLSWREDKLFEEVLDEINKLPAREVLLHAQRLLRELMGAQEGKERANKTSSSDLSEEQFDDFLKAGIFGVSKNKSVLIAVVKGLISENGKDLLKREVVTLDLLKKIKDATTAEYILEKGVLNDFLESKESLTNNFLLSSLFETKPQDLKRKVEELGGGQSRSEKCSRFSSTEGGEGIVNRGKGRGVVFEF